MGGLVARMEGLMDRPNEWMDAVGACIDRWVCGMEELIDRWVGGMEGKMDGMDGWIS